MIDRAAQNARAGLRDQRELRVGRGKGLQQNADELLHGFLREQGFKKEYWYSTITRRRGTKLGAIR